MLPRRVLLGITLGAAAVLAAALVLRVRMPATAPTPDLPTVVERMREVARLETLEVNVYKKVRYDPEPVASGSVWRDVFAWARTILAPSHGRAIVFGTVRVGLDLSRLDARSLAIQGGRVDVVLPPLETRAEVRPAETEIIQSNLDSAETAQLLDLARVAFEQDARADAGLQRRARESAERAIGGLLLSLGFRDVRFVTQLPGAM
jgi:Protein of unknown function (DUF4230)